MIARYMQENPGWSETIVAFHDFLQAYSIDVISPTEYRVVSILNQYIELE